MTDLIARAHMWLRSLLPAGRGAHRRRGHLPVGESPVAPASGPEPVGEAVHADEEPPKNPDPDPEPTEEADDSRVILMEDESLLVPWYVVLAESAAWLERLQAEQREREEKRRAQRTGRVQALMDAAGIEVHGRVYGWPQPLAAAG